MPDIEANAPENDPVKVLSNAVKYFDIETYLHFRNPDAFPVPQYGEQEE